MAEVSASEIQGALMKTVNIMDYLSSQAQEKEFLKKVTVSVPATVLADSVPVQWSYGPKRGDLRGHRVNLVSDFGDVFEGVTVNIPVKRGQYLADFTMKLQRPDAFLEGQVGVVRDSVDSKPAEPFKIESTSTTESSSGQNPTSKNPASKTNAAPPPPSGPIRES